MATKAESKPVSSDEDFKLEKMKDEDTDTAVNESDDSDGSVKEEDLDEYAKGFLAEMNEEERKVARGDDMLCTMLVAFLIVADLLAPLQSSRRRRRSLHGRGR